MIINALHTAAASPMVKQVTRQFGDDKISFVFCNVPLNEIHPHAQNAAEAADAEAAQNNKFWEIQDYLFEHYKR